MKSKKREVLPRSKSKKVSNGLGKILTLQEISHYLVENNIKSLNLDEEGGLAMKFWKKRI
ncbi:MAG: hypothetical protein I3273_07215 [Candidatus Moeniiplasma glomeromycotorum]|nr:hypothetical protein [Candidatus Moeniiplasma glomeromycotorum]